MSWLLLIALAQGAESGWSGGDPEPQETSAEATPSAPVAESPEAPSFTEHYPSQRPYLPRLGESAYYWGFRHGRWAADEEPGARPAVVGFGAGVVAGGVGTFLLGPCLGLPVFAAGCAGPGVGYLFSPVAPDPDPTRPPPLSAEEALQWDEGYARGYQSETRYARSQRAMLGGTVGVLVGATIGMTASTLVLQRWGYI